MATHLSENFTLEELIKSEYALRHGIDNRPREQAIVDNLRALCENILQPVRDRYGPFMPTSGYRCPDVNRGIGGSETSQHTRGQAADFEVPGVPNHELATWIRANLPFDQLILECYTPGEPNSGWVHCSYDAGGGRQIAMTYSKETGYRDGLIA